MNRINEPITYHILKKILLCEMRGLKKSPRPANRKIVLIALISFVVVLCFYSFTNSNQTFKTTCKNDGQFSQLFAAKFTSFIF